MFPTTDEQLQNTLNMMKSGGASSDELKVVIDKFVDNKYKKKDKEISSQPQSFGSGLLESAKNLAVDGGKTTLNLAGTAANLITFGNAGVGYGTENRFKDDLFDKGVEGAKQGFERGEKLREETQELIPEQPGLKDDIQRFGLNKMSDLTTIASTISGAGEGATEDIISPVIQGGINSLSDEQKQFISEKAQPIMNWYNDLDEETKIVMQNAGILGEGVATLAGGGLVKGGATKTLKSADNIVLPAIREGAEQVGEGIGKNLNKLEDATGRAGTFMASQASGLEPDTMKFIFNNPDTFEMASSGRLNSETILNEVKDTFDRRSFEISELGSEYQSIRDLDVDIQVDQGELQKILSNKGLKVDDGNIVEAAKNSSNLNKSDINVVSQAYDIIKDIETAKPNEVLNIRNKLDDLISWEKSPGLSEKGKVLVKELRSSIDNRAKSQLPELRRLDEQFAEEKEIISQMKKDFFNRDGSLKDTAPSKILNLTNKNREIILKRLETTNPGISTKLKALKAFNDVDRSLGNKVGTYAKAAGMGLFLSGGNFLAAGAMAGLSGNAGNIIKTIGKANLKRLTKKAAKFIDEKGIDLNELTEGGRLNIETGEISKIPPSSKVLPSELNLYLDVSTEKGYIDELSRYLLKNKRNISSNEVGVWELENGQYRIDIIKQNE